MSEVQHGPAGEGTSARLASPQHSLTGEALSSLREIFLHLEGITLQQEREWLALSMPALRDRLSRQPRILLRPPASQVAPTPSPHAVRQQILRTSRVQVRLLQARIEEAKTKVLINEGAAAQQLWWGLITDAKIPLLSLRLLRSLFVEPTSTSAGSSVADKQPWDQLALIQSGLELLAGRPRDSLELSDAMEQYLAPWVARLADILELLNEDHPA